MHRTQSFDYDIKLLEALDPEIERTFHILRRTVKHIITEEASHSRYTESPPRFNAVVELS